MVRNFEFVIMGEGDLKSPSYYLHLNFSDANGSPQSYTNAIDIPGYLNILILARFPASKTPRFAFRTKPTI